MNVPDKQMIKFVLTQNFGYTCKLGQVNPKMRMEPSSALAKSEFQAKLTLVSSLSTPKKFLIHQEALNRL